MPELLWELHPVLLVTQHQQALIISGLDLIVSKSVQQDTTEILHLGDVLYVTRLVTLVLLSKPVLHVNKVST